MSCRPAGKFLAVSGSLALEKEPSLGQADCQIHAKGRHHGQFEELLSTDNAVWEFGLGEGTQLHPLKGPICRSRNRDLERVDTGPGHSGLGAPAGHQISLEPVMIFEVGQCRVGASPLGNGQFVPCFFAPNQSGRMWPSPCSFAFSSWKPGPSQGSGQPSWRERGDPLGLCGPFVVHCSSAACVDM